MIRSEPLSLRVADVEPLSDTLRRVTFAPAVGDRLPTSLPGAHLVVTLPGDKRAFRNSYSIVSPHEDRSRYQIIVRRTPNSRGGSHYVHDRLAIGDVISASVPNGQFTLHAMARKHLLIGGGIGITPILSFLHILDELGQRYEVHQFARAGEVPVFEGLLAPYASHNVHVHPSRDTVDLERVLARQPLGTHVYCCGPEALIDRVRDLALGIGWPDDAIHSESFGAIGGAPFVARLRSDGREIAVGEDQSLLEALEDAGVPIGSLCRGGACGECRTGVVDGTPEHRDHFLSAAEKESNRVVMPCVSRSKTPMLLLDL